MCQRSNPLVLRAQLFASRAEPMVCQLGPLGWASRQWRLGHLVWGMIPTTLNYQTLGYHRFVVVSRG